MTFLKAGHIVLNVHYNTFNVPGNLTMKRNVQFVQGSRGISLKG